MTTSASTNSWLAPISDDLPCGINMEYSPEYMALMSKISPQDEVQYGDFIDTPEPPNWSEIQRESQHLLKQTKDITVFIVWLRCRTRLAGPQGLKEGFTVLKEVLGAFTEHIYPQPFIDGEFDLHMRANALSLLADREGLLNDLRHLSFTGPITRSLSIRQIERAFITPQQDDALPMEAIKQELENLYLQDYQPIHDIVDAGKTLHDITQWIDTHLPDMTVNLKALQQIFAIFLQIAVAAEEKKKASELTSALDVSIANADNTTFISPQSSTPLAMTNNIQTRHTAAQSLQHIRQWFEDNEPSSPISLLLWQAENMIGKRFCEIAQCVPHDVLTRWETEMQESQSQKSKTK